MTEITLSSSGKALLDRHAAWWKRQETLISISRDAPLDRLWLPLSNGTIADEDFDLYPGMLDLENLAGAPQQPGPLQFSQVHFQSREPYGKVPWLEATLGAPVRVTVDSGGMRTPPYIQDLTEWNRQENHINKAWFDTLIQLTRMLVERSRGRFAVVQPTLRGPSDLAEALLGPQMMSFAMVDTPHELNRFLDIATGTFIHTLHNLLAVTRTVAGGCLTPYGIWAPGTVVRTQCDATAFLSARHYADWYLPHDLRICQSVEYSIMHLHSVSLHTVDSLLAQEHPHAFEITLEARPKGPSLEEMLPVFQRILAVKPLLLVGKLSQQEVEWLRDRLPSGGLAITARQEEW